MKRKKRPGQSVKESDRPDIKRIKLEKNYFAAKKNEIKMTGLKKKRQNVAVGPRVSMLMKVQWKMRWRFYFIILKSRTFLP